MENALSRIMVACDLARRLEANLQDMANQPQSLLRSCEEVAAAFDEAICSLLPRQRPPHMLFGDASGSQAMDLLGRRDVGEDDDPPNNISAHGRTEDREMEPTAAFGIDSSCFAPAADLMPSVGGGGGGERGGAALEGSSSGYGRRTSGSTSGQRSSRKRKESSKTHTIKVPAALGTGNMDVPPDDGFTWRKYGQKDILGSKFPRSYYRCTHKNFYGCEAKKQVQRLDEEPYTYEVTYCGEHTCLTSPTPLIMLHHPSGSYDVQQQGEEPVSNQLDQYTQLSSSLPTSIQLSIGLASQQYNDGSESRGTNAGPSDCPVAELADAMFNSASSGSSIDAIFSLKQEKYKDRE